MPPLPQNIHLIFPTGGMKNGLLLLTDPVNIICQELSRFCFCRNAACPCLPMDEIHLACHRVLLSHRVQQPELPGGSENIPRTNPWVRDRTGSSIHQDSPAAHFNNPACSCGPSKSGVRYVFISTLHAWALSEASSLAGWSQAGSWEGT